MVKECFYRRLSQCNRRPCDVVLIQVKAFEHRGCRKHDISKLRSLVDMCVHNNKEFKCLECLDNLIGAWGGHDNILAHDDTHLRLVWITCCNCIYGTDV